MVALGSQAHAKLLCSGFVYVLSANSKHAFKLSQEGAVTLCNERVFCLEAPTSADGLHCYEAALPGSESECPLL